MLNKKIIVLLTLSVILSASVYIVPQEYDNMIKSAKSISYGLITNSSTASSNSYQIGGQTVTYKCLPIPKLICTAATAEINANISEASLKRPATEELVQTFQLDIRVEEDAINWYVCGAGYGGQLWDNSTLASITNADGSVSLSYTYDPNVNSEEYYYFTSIGNASAQSYMSVSYSQVCR